MKKIRPEDPMSINDGYLFVAAYAERFHSLAYRFRLSTDPRPGCGAQDENPNGAPRQILLIPEIFISRNQYVVVI